MGPVLRHSHRMHARLLLVLAALATATGCGSTSDEAAELTRTKSCSPDGRTRAGEPDGDYRHFIYHAGRLYASDFIQPSSPPLFSKAVGKVTCRFSGSKTPLDYSASREGEASFLDEGSPYFAVEGKPEQEEIGAYYDGRRRLFRVVGPDG